MCAKKIERIGIGLLEILFGETEWLFREQPVSDFGIDAQVEIVNKGEYPTGQLIAFQVKTGDSYLKEEGKESIIFRPAEKHVKYWTKHCLPVVIIICDHNKKILYWHHFTSDSIKKTRTGNGYIIEISKQNILTKENYNDLRIVHSKRIYIDKLNKLIFDMEWIKLVAEGEVVKIKFVDWVNKSLPRTNIKIFCQSNKNIHPVEIPTIYCPGSSSFYIIKNYFVWANLKEDFDDPDVRADFWPLYKDECYMGYNSEDNEALYLQSFES